MLDSFPQGRSGGGRGRAVITASNAMEFAFEGDRLADDQHRRPSVFTSALVEGLATGDADRDEDGLVSLNELYDYVFDKVQEQNPHQTPSRQVEMEGELYLARSRRRRIRPAPIPADLQAAITDQNMYTRRGAVHELDSRLASEDLPVAAGAYEALTELARTDIRYVADLAAAALDRAAVRPEETELDFGEQRQGSVPPHRFVRLLGLPIARACEPRASDDWIRVNEVTEGLDISVDTTSMGILRGSVDLKGATGTAVIGIDVELVSQAVPRQQQIEQLQAQMREHAAAQDWDVVLAVSDQLAALDPAAADPDALASTARQQITRQREAERAEDKTQHLVDDQPTGLGELLWTIADAQGLSRADLSARLTGWSEDAVEAYLSGARVPGWSFVTAFLDVVAEDHPENHEVLERRLRPVWETARTRSVNRAFAVIVFTLIIISVVVIVFVVIHL